MADKYKVLHHSITHAPVDVLDGDGEISQKRQSFQGDTVELGAADARSLLKAGAVELVGAAKQEAAAPKK